MRFAPWLAITALSLLGCTEEQIKGAAQGAANATKEHAANAVDAAKEGAVNAGEWVAQKHASGELSARTKTMLSAAGDGIESTVAAGSAVAPIALDLAKTAYHAFDKDTDIEAIYQAIDDEAAARKLDAQISDMPRVETIDGLKVGFKDLTETNAAVRTTESAYLVTWVQDDHLVGFVYRSKTHVDLEQIIATMPRIIARAKAAL